MSTTGRPRSGRTAVPWASKLAIGAKNPLDKRGAVVSALGADSLDLTRRVDKQHLGLKALDLDFLLITGFEFERADALELVFLRHRDSCG